LKNIVILISGRGSNMEALLAAALPCRIAAVISNRPNALGLTTAARQGIAVETVDHQGFSSRDAFDLALQSAIDKHRPDLVVLAGFMRVLGRAFVEHYAHRILNIHPSLLPAFPGLHTHKRALEAGCRVHGATAHFVTPELDHGPIIMQAATAVRSDDTEASLAARVLTGEHQIYPQSVRWFLEGALTIEGSSVVAPGPQQLWIPA
jgi:phosphoribosylglycinamide formyltransferase 1